MAAPSVSAPMRAIVEALVGVAAAVPVACNISIDRGRVTFQAHTDEGVRALAALFGVEVREVQFDGSTWLAAGSQGAQGGVAIFGPHHKLEPAVALDEQAVAIAVDQANAAIAGASS